MIAVVVVDQVVGAAGLVPIMTEAGLVQADLPSALTALTLKKYR